jgi:hypothetical protein
VRYQNKGRRYETDFVLIGFMTENIFRTVNRFRPFYQPDTGLPLAKPRFLLHEDSIVFLPNPLPSLSDYQDLLYNQQRKMREMGVYDYFYQQRYTSGPLDWSPGIRLLKLAIESMVVRFADEEPIKEGVYNETSEAFIVTTRVFDLFYRSCQEKSVPIILIFPHRGDVQQALHNGRKEYAPLLAYFDSRGYRYIDLMVAFEGEFHTDTLDELFIGDHYSAKGNALVAEHVLHYIDGCIVQPGGMVSN